MSSSALRAKLEALKSGNLSSEDEEEEEFYNEEDQDNYEEELDDFVVNDEDVGYKASAHQKQQYRTDKNRNNRNINNRDRSRQRSSQQSQSYNIRRKTRNQHTNHNKNDISQSSQSKTQSMMSSYFKKSSSNPTKSRVSINRKNKLKKKKNKPSSNTKQNDDDFMSNIMANMDSDDDDMTNHQPMDHQQPQELEIDSTTDLQDTFMDDDDDDIPSTEPQSHLTSQCNPQSIEVDPASNTLRNEPPKKRFKFATNNTSNDKQEMSDKEDDEDVDMNMNMNMNINKDKDKDKDKDVTDSKEPTPENPSNSMFTQSMSNNTNNNSNNKNKEATPENTDNYPQCKPGFIDFFWFDAYEDPIRKPGQIYLFGKTLTKQNQWQSICVFIKNIQRTLYVLPRLKNKSDDIDNGERIEFINVYNEMNEKRQRLRIPKFAAMPIEKKYCFRERSHGIPSSCTYLKVCYSFNDPAFQGPAYERGQTYEKVFGVRSTALELFILDKQIMGPCWLRIPYKKASRIVSWCKLELELDDPDKVTVLSSNYPSPNFKVLSLSFQTVLNDKKEHEIACISGVINNAVCVDHSNRNKNVVGNQNTDNIEYFTFIRKIDRNPFPYDLEKELKHKNYNLTPSTFKSFNTERELLTFFTTRIQMIDPDVIVAHKLYDFLLDVILHRMDRLKIDKWSKIGRLRRKQIPFIRGRLMRKYLGSGRLLCDTFSSSQEFIHQKTYTLSHLVEQLLQIKGHENIPINTIKKRWFDGKELSSIITHCCNDSNLVLQLMFKLQILPLTKELTNLCGNLWSRSLTSQRAERNEWLLLHEFHRNGYIVPEKLTKQEKIQKGIISDKSGNGKKRGKAQYSGGLVLEPIKGLYDKYVLCLDFNSLYPSIIQEYNLCFTSTQHWKYETRADVNNDNGDEKEQNEMTSITKMQETIGAETGILPKVIGVLLTRRSTVKKLLKSAKQESEKKRFDIQQKALKLVANSMYGCLGFEQSRFYCKPIASLITALGREALMKASEMASTIGNLKVIYGDTDSIFIYTDSDNLIQARNYGKEVKKKVNKTYKKMYLEIDYVFSKMLLLRKKKYAAIKVISFDTDSSGNATNIKTTKEIKGLDLVRRDWSIISKDVGKKVLDVILSKDKQIDDVVIGIQELLQNYRKLIDENKIELNRFIITKKLTKQPKDYPDPTKQPHVMVAMEMQKLGMNVNTGSFIEYIICTRNRDGSSATSGGSNKSIAQRAYHIKEIEKSMQTPQQTPDDATDGSQVLEVDRQWYLEQQILPPVGRYCDPIEGTDIGHLAHALGLDSNKYVHLTRSSHGNGSGAAVGDDDDEDMEDKILRLTNPLQKYNDTCIPLKIKCKHCGATYHFGGVFDFRKVDAKCGLICATPNCKGIVGTDPTERTRDIKSIQNTLSLQIWHFIYQYYGREWICMDRTCGHKTRQLPLNGNKCPKIGCAANLKESYKASTLFDQLRYFAFLFDRMEQQKLLKQEIANNKNLANTKLNQHQIKVFDEIYKWIKETILERSRYYFIDSKVIFKYL